MLADGLSLVEGSVLDNASVISGTTFPANASLGELFFRSDLNSLFVHNGLAWVEMGAVGTPDANALTGTTLASNVVASSLTSLGTLTSLTASGAINSTFAAGINAANYQLNGTSMNWIGFNTQGVAVPSVITNTSTGAGRSAGTKLVLFPTQTTGRFDYALGIEPNNMWFSAGGGDGFKWYSNVSEVMRVSNTGAIAFGSSGTAFGTSGQLLTSSGSGAAPIWSSVLSGLTLSDTTLSGTSVVTSRLEMTSYTEQTSAITSTATQNIDCALGNMFPITLSTSITTLTFSNLPASGKAFSLSLFITQADGGSKTVSWPAAVKWSGGTAPTLTTTAGKVDVISLVTFNAGTIWYGFVGGLNF